MNSSHPLTARSPDDIIAWSGGDGIRVGRFVSEVRTLAKQLPNHRYVINLASDRYDFLVGLCAAMVANQCTLLPPNRQPNTLQQLIDDYPDCYSFGETGIDRIPGFIADQDPAADVALAEVPEIPDDQLCAILFTSGSTGASTPHRKYWRTFRDGALINEKGYRLRGGKVSMLATVPPQHNWGLETSILLPLVSPIAISSEMPLFPDDIARGLTALPEPRVLVSSPIHLDAFLRADTGDLRIDHILSATAPMSQELAQELEERYGAQVTEVFGCSEAGSLAWRATASESTWHIMDAFRFDLRNDGVQVSGAHLPEDVLLSDRLEIVGDRRFRWLGRDQDMINIAGKRGSLAHLNYHLNQIPGVIDGVIFLPDETSKRLAALVVAPELEPSAILENLKQAIEPAFLPRPLYKVQMLPRQETGKLARKAMLELFENQRNGTKSDGESATRSG